MTRIVAISDTHNQHSRIRLPDADILIHCGDATLRGLDWEWCDFKVWLNCIARQFKYIIFVSGNHDFNTEDSMKDKATLPKNFIYLEDQGIELEGIKFYGTPWVTKFYDWAFMAPDEDLVKIYDKIDPETQVLISHGPPYSVLDENKHQEFCGSKALLSKVKTLQHLELHLFGHIHESAGIENIDDIIFANCAQLNEYYELQFKPLVFFL